MKKYFVPIIKTKRNAEIPLLKETRSLLEENQIIPYIEFTKPHASLKTFVERIDGLFHFEELLFKDAAHDLNSTIDYFKTIPFKPYIIQSFRIRPDESIPDSLFEYLKERSENGGRSAIRINAGTPKETVEAISSNITQADYIIIDLEDTEYNAAFPYLKMIRDKLNNKENIIVFSREIPNRVPGKEYPDREYDRVLINTSLVTAAKDPAFPFMYFGTHASAKDDLTEEAFKAPNVFGKFLIFDITRNAYYCIKSDTPDHVARVYRQIKAKIDPEEIEELFLHTPRSRKMLEDYISNPTGKASSSGFMKVSILHYLEEIIWFFSD